MKKKAVIFVLPLVVVFLCLFPNFVRSEESINAAESTAKESFVWMQDLEKARARARVEKKPLFVMFRCEP